MFSICCGSEREERKENINTIGFNDRRVERSVCEEQKFKRK